LATAGKAVSKPADPAHAVKSRRVYLWRSSFESHMVVQLLFGQKQLRKGVPWYVTNRNAAGSVVRCLGTWAACACSRVL